MWEVSLARHIEGLLDKEKPAGPLPSGRYRVGLAAIG
jgi:hypothetical protein